MTRREVQLYLIGLITRTKLHAVSFRIEQNVGSSPIVDDEGRIAFRFPIFSGFVNFDIGGGQILKMACVPGGTGLIGANRNWNLLDLKSIPIRRVRIQPFLLGCFEVTRAQWFRAAQLPQVNRQLVVLFSEPKTPEEGNWPVEAPISFLQAEEFCARIGAHTGVSFRLPSEAEWEYSCRAGTITDYHFGRTIGPDRLNSPVLSLRRFQPVGSLNAPNRFGLHDMHGGMLEWCQDYPNASYDGAPTDGSPWLNSGNRQLRIVRGFEGSMDGGSSARWSFLADGYVTTLGLRVAASVDHGIHDPTLLAATNSASYAVGIVSPGQLISIFGENLGPEVPASGSVEAGFLSRELQGVEVYFDDLKAPILFASRRQLNVIAPFGVVGKESVRIVVRNRFQSTHFMNALCQRTQPAIFSIDGSGKGQAAALNTDGSLNGPDSPLTSGAIAVVFGTGFGLFEAVVTDGQIMLRAEALRERVRVFAGGQDCSVLYAGSAPGQVAGIVQVNFRIPEGLRAGAVDVVIEIGGRRSPDGLKVFVR